MIDPAKITETLSVLIGSGNVCEIRVLCDRKRTDGGYFDDFQQAAKSVAGYAADGEVKGIYLVLNQIDPSLLSRASNRMQRYANLTTSDKDVTRRRWLYIDCDPKRPAGISSTDAECQLAMDRAEQIREWLISQGCSEPITAMSGNGAHLLVPIDLENTDQTLQLVKTVLEVISDKFSDAAVDVDQSVCNAARICRLYGTVARKGDSTPERPHRISELRHVPDYLRYAHEATPANVLQSIALLKAPQKPPERRQATSADIQRDLLFPAFLRRLGIEYKPSKGPKGDIYQIDCPFDPNHKKPDAYVGQMPSGALTFHCSHNSCADRKWREFTDQVGKPEPDEWDPPFSKPTVQNPPPKTEQTKPQPEAPKKPSVTVTTLRAAALEYARTINDEKAQLFRLGLSDLDFALAGGVAAGEMVLVAARPSHGKSMVALQAIHNLTAAGIECCFMSEEMSEASLGKRAAQYATDTDEDDWKQDPEQFKAQLSVHFHQRAECHIIENSRTTTELCNRVRELKETQDIRAVVIDYAQLLSSPGNGRYEQVTNTSIALRQLTTELNLMTLVLCQLNREVEKRSSFAPQMSDLKDSGQLEQDADVLLSLVWPHKMDSARPDDEYLIYVQKNRHREIRRSVVPCRIEPNRQRIVSPMSQFDTSFT